MTDGYTTKPNDMILRRLAECDENYISPDLDSAAVKLYDVTFRWLGLPWKNISAEHDTSNDSVSAGRDKIDRSLNVDCTVVELDDLTFRRLRLPQRNVPDVRDEKNDIDDRVFRHTSFPTNEPHGGRNDDYIWLTSESNQSVCVRPVTGSLCSRQPHRLLSLSLLLIECDSDAELPLSTDSRLYYA